MSLLAAGLACAPAPPAPEVHPLGLRWEAERPLARFVLTDPSGVVRVDRRLPEPLRAWDEPVQWDQAGAWSLGWAAEPDAPLVQTPVVLPALPPAGRLEVEAPAGQAAAPVGPGGSVDVPVLPGRPASVVLRLALGRPARVEATLGGETLWSGAQPAGARLVWHGTVDGPLRGTVTVDGQSQPLALLPRAVDPAAAAGALSLGAPVFPARADGTADPARPPGVLVLPAAWLWPHLARLGLGPPGPERPWAWVGVPVENRGERPWQVVVRAGVDGEDGLPDPAFRPRVRGAGDGSGRVQALLRVAPGETATALLPIYVDRLALLSRPPSTPRLGVELAVLGWDAPVDTRTAPITVQVGSRVATPALAAWAVLGLAGAAFAARRLGAWLRLPTAMLFLVGLFSAVQLVVGGAVTLLSAGLGAVLGPFAVFFTALVDDTLRVLLLAVLVQLAPRPGVAGLFVLVGWLLGGVVFGAFSPVDPFFVGARVLLLELGFWAVGLTSGAGAPRGAAVRVGLVLAVAGGLGAAATLASQAVLYRLAYAPGWVFAVVLGPGVLYPLLGAALARPVTDALRAVQR